MMQASAITEGVQTMTRAIVPCLIVLAMACVALAATPALAVDGQVLITQAKAVAGNVTPGDAAGFPVTLSRPGSYALGSDLLPGPGRDGIDVTAPDVSIDLNGFRLSGGPAGGTNNSRIGIWGRGDRLTVTNGTIGAFENAAIHNVSRDYLIVENMRLINSLYGVYNYLGTFARIQNVTVATNTDGGVLCGHNCHVSDSNISENGGYGVFLYSGTVLGNTIMSNRLFGIITGSGSLHTGFGNNTIMDNNQVGGDTQISGQLGSLHPNACAPVAC
jgi:hypothetical protein